MNDIETQLFENVKEFVGFARKRLGDPELAADAVQESLLKALKAVDQTSRRGKCQGLVLPDSATNHHRSLPTPGCARASPRRT